MSIPPMAPVQLRVHGRRAWRLLEILGTVGAILVSLLLASGWRIQQPSEVMANTAKAIDSIATRTTALERNYDTLASGMRTVIRMQCLSLTRREANLAGTCTDLPTKDDASNRRR
jgi:hypothetical protein